MKKTLILCTSLCLAAAANAAVIYSANFNNSTNNAALTQGGGTWRAVYGTTADDSTYNGGGGNGPSLSNGIGSTGTSGFVFLVLNNLTTNKPYFLFDSAAVFDTSVSGTSAVGDLDTFSFSFSRGSGDAGIFARIALQIGSDWFLTTESFTNVTANTWTDKSFDIQTATFTPLTMVIDTELSFPGTVTGTLAALGATGNLTSVGAIASDLGGGTPRQWRFDTVEVTAIPEPSTYAALIGLLALCVVAYRRRK